MIESATQSRSTTGIRRRVFIVGCYRSGTTLLEHVVRCHPDVVGLGFETALFTHIVPGRTLAEFNRDRWMEVLQHHFGVADWRELPGDPLDVFDEIAESLAREHEASVFVEKTPFHLFHVEGILARYPDAKILHAVRDGRDVVTSILGGGYPLSRWRNRGVRLLAASALWEWMVFEGNRLAEQEKERVHTVHYEDLVRSPSRTLESVGGFLGLDLQDGRPDAWLAGTRDIGSNSSFDPMQGISDEGVGRWRDPQRLHPSEADLLDRLLTPSLSLLGYEPKGAPVPRLKELYARTGKLLFVLLRIARFRENTGYWPPQHAWSFVRHLHRTT